MDFKFTQEYITTGLLKGAVIFLVFDLDHFIDTPGTTSSF